jgi:hypothetical protein
LMQHLTFVVLEVCLATRGRAIHCGTNSPFAALQRFLPLFEALLPCRWGAPSRRTIDPDRPWALRTVATQQSPLHGKTDILVSASRM